jgi:hypothetical protein
MPALPAGALRCTPRTTTPFASGSFSISANSGVTSSGSTPKYPRVTLPFLINWSITWVTMVVGIAKPIPTESPVREKMALLIPTNVPVASIRAPPELP